MGGLDVQKVVGEHQGWRLVVCIWLHAGVVHIFANMLSLLFIGIRLEQEFGFGMQQLFCSLISFSCWMQIQNQNDLLNAVYDLYDAFFLRIK